VIKVRLDIEFKNLDKEQEYYERMVKFFRVFLTRDDVHEMSLMGGVFEVIEQNISQHKLKRVLQVKLKVGELTNAEPDALQMAFEAYCKDTICEGADLLIERVPVYARCRNCQYEFNVKGMIFLCPNCQDVNIEVIQGEELLLESLEVE